MDLKPITTNSPRSLPELTVGMKGVFYDGATRNKLWQKIDRALKMQNPETRRTLAKNEEPSLAQLASMTYYPSITSTGLGGFTSYQGFHNGKDLYLAETTGGLSGRTTTWHVLPGFDMPPPSEPAFR